MNPRVLIALVLAVALLLGGAVVAAQRAEDAPKRVGPLRFEGATLPQGLRAPDFSLRDQDGRPISMREQRGRPVIVTFLYTTCEDTCPVQAQQIKGAFDELGHDVPAIAIAVDPPRDTPDRARAFLSEQRMTGRLDFALASRARLAPVWKAFGVEPQRKDLEHTGRLVLVDPKGIQRVGFPVSQVTPERLAHDIRLLAAGH